MPYVTGPVGTLLVALTALVALVLWIRRDRTYPGPRLEGDDDGIDREELDAAEREVRDLDSGQRPDEEFPGNDWGPGKPRPPERL